MSVRREKNGSQTDTVIAGFEQGISDSPESGIADIRGANITSVPGEVSVSLATAAGTLPPTGQSGIAVSVNSGTGTATVSATTNYFSGMAIKIASTSATPTMQSLVVAGGGSGGDGEAAGNTIGGGGGGGGGVISTVGFTPAVGAYTVTVGNGGVASGGKGQDSSFNGITAAGGGNGAGFHSGSVGAGGSGGGGTDSTVGAGTLGQGHDGGQGNGAAGNTSGGGGGGAGTVGSNANTTGTAGNGGNGTASSISGASVTYGGGGGGAAGSGFGSPVSGTGGTGGGGAGSTSGSGTAGTANTGGGGGGSGNNTANTGGAGGKGVVIISYPTGAYTATGGTITTSGGNTIHTFNSTATFTITAISPAVGDVYYVGSLTSTTFKLYYDPTLSHQVSLAGNFTGTFDIPVPTTPVFSTTYGLNSAVISTVDNLTFFIDNTGNVWFIPTTTQNYTGGLVTAGSVQYTGNVGHTTSGTSLDFGVGVYGGYLLAIINRSIDYISLANLFDSTVVSKTWVFGWKSTLNQTSYQHQALTATDGNFYICNGASVASIVVQPNQTFDPTNSATYTYNIAAIPLPVTDAAQCLGQLPVQNTLLVGGVGNQVYVFNEANPGGGIANILICADRGIYRIVGTNSGAYVFAGTRGRIFVTDGGTIQIYKKIPDALSGAPEPYYVWQDALYLRNKLYFTMTGTTNAGVALTNMGGIWSLGIDAGQTTLQLPTAGSLYNCNQFSYGTYGGSCPVLFINPSSSAPGYGINGIWVNGSTIGLDISSSTPYTNFQTYIDTEIIPIGTYYDPNTDAQVEYKLSYPLAAGEQVRVSWRGNLSSAFTAIWTSSATGQISDAKQVNFQKNQWIQFRIELSSTASTPSYVRFTELRFR